MFTWRFWREAVERAVKSGAQGVLLVWGVGEGFFDAFAMDWQLALSAAVGGALLSVVTSLATLKVGASDSPSAIT